MILEITLDNVWIEIKDNEYNRRENDKNPVLL